MKALRLWGLLGVVVLAGGLLPGTLSPQAPPQRRTDSAERFEREQRRREAEAKREKSRRRGTARAERLEALHQLRQDLPKLRDGVEALERGLAETDVEKELSVALREQGEAVEKLAQRIYKNIKRL